MSIIETSLYAPAENPNRLVYIGQKKAFEVFNELYSRLKKGKNLPDEYFLLNNKFQNGELFPENAEILCNVNWGGNEGIYLDVTLRTRNEKGELQYRQFATGKTLGESDDDLDRMYTVAAACTKAFHSPGVHNRFILTKEKGDELENSKALKELYNSLAFEKEFRPALHIEYEVIGDTASELLTGILDRDVFVEAQRSDYYDWNLETVESISENEMEKLFDILQANKDDRNNQYNEDFPTKWICQRLSCKLLGKLAPFPVSNSFADDKGVWFLGELVDFDSFTNKTEH